MAAGEAMMLPASSLVYVASRRRRRAGKYEVTLRDVFTNEVVMTVTGGSWGEAMSRVERLKGRLKRRQKARRGSHRGAEVLERDMQLRLEF